jgi:hypothetical protein
MRSFDLQQDAKKEPPAVPASKCAPCATINHESNPNPGNLAIQDLLRHGAVRPKLTVSDPSDPEERHADDVARQLLNPPASSRVGCSCNESACPKCRARRRALFRKSESSSTASEPEALHRVLRSSGRPLDSDSREYFEPRLGVDLSDVRIHTHSEAAASARALDALAYTWGTHIVFAPEQYSPRTDSGRQLLAHELAHVAHHQIPEALQRQAAKPAPSLAGAKTSDPSQPPSISQGPIGDVILGVPDWTFFDLRVLSKDWAAKLDETSLLSVPIPDLGVRLGISGEASARAFFMATLGPGSLRNIKIGLSYKQAAVLEVLALVGGLELDALAIRFGALGLDDIRALADLDFRAGVNLGFGAYGALKAAASALGLFDVATLKAELSATANAGFPLKFGGPVGLYYSKGHLTFRFSQSLEAQMNLLFSLVASITATLLGFSWSKSWNLIQKSLGYKWVVGTPLNLRYDNHSDADMPLNEESKAGVLPEWLKSILTAAASVDDLHPLAPQTTPASPTGPNQPPGGGSAPSGRSPSDPIDMIWFKSPGLYPISVDLAGNRYFFTEPNYVMVPPGSQLSDIRREADTNGNIKIGVSPGSKFYPKIGDVWPRVRVGPVRGGTKQRQFRRLLEALGFNWGTMEADHVRDLQWRGEDDYENLWPLEAARNNAANQVLEQLVTYRDNSGNVVTTTLKSTPLNRYFRIIGF